MIPESLLEDLRSSARPRTELVPDPGSTAVTSLALVAGSFDPMTIAHAALAEAAAARARIVALVYSVRTLPKEPAGLPRSLLSERDRLVALERYCSAHPRTVVGLASHGLLVEQVQGARDRFPHARLFVAAGSDKIAQLFDPRWYAHRDDALDLLFDEATVLYAVRAGDEAMVRGVLSRSENARWRSRLERLDVPPEVAAISAQGVRRMIVQGENALALVPAELRGLVTRFLPHRRRLRSRTTGR